MLKFKDFKARKPEKLSNVPSKLIRQTVRHVRFLIKNDNVEFNMDRWGVITNEHCEVCLAGAVIARTESIYGDSLSKFTVSARVSLVMSALDLLRRGNIYGFIQGCQDLGYTIDSDNIYKISLKLITDFQSKLRIIGTIDKDKMSEYCDTLLEFARALEKLGH